MENDISRYIKKYVNLYINNNIDEHTDKWANAGENITSVGGSNTRWVSPIENHILHQSAICDSTKHLNKEVRVKLGIEVKKYFC